MKPTHLLTLCVSLLVLSDCTETLQKSLTPEASGTPYDLYVVMPEGLRDTALGDTIKSIFEYPMECTPNGDEYFKLRYLSPDNFKSRLIRIVACVLEVDIDAQNASTPIVKAERNKYASGQLIIHCSARDADTLAVHLSTLAEGLRRAYVGSEINRRITLLRKDNNHTQGDRLLELQNVSMLIPDNMKTPGVGEADTTFFWTTDDGLGKQNHIVVYSIPYTDAGVFTLDGAVAVRDSVLGANIKGGVDGSYMSTNKRIILPEYKALNVGGKYVGELRGVWRIENGLMAGPFVCHIRLDELNKRVVFAEGFVYAPNDGKRLLLRNLEAALYTLQLPSDNSIADIEVTID